jgi:hypothetical protein
VLGGVVKCDCSIVMHAALRDVSRVKQGGAHVAMPDHERNRSAPFLGECQEMSCEVETDVGIKGQNVCRPDAEEDGEQ